MYDVCLMAIYLSQIECFTCTSGIQVLVDPETHGFNQFGDRDTQLSVPSFDQKAVRFLNDSVNCLFNHPAVIIFERDNANYFYSFVFGIVLWSSRQGLREYMGRERIPLASILGDPLLASFDLQCLDISIILDTTWTTDRLSRNETQCKTSILDPQSHVLRDSVLLSAIALRSSSFRDPW